MPAHDAREAAQHVIERDEAVGQDHALDRRVRDVALVPERDVLERRLALPRSSRARPTICSQPIGLRLCGIADEPFWPLRERLLDLADLGLLQAADLERELLERRGGDGERRQQLGVAIALDHLRRDRRRLEAEPAADVGLDRGRQVRERADRARQLADAIAVARARARARRRGRAPRTRAPASGRTSSARRARRACGRSSASGGARRRGRGSRSASASRSCRIRSQASRICSACAVSTTSDEVRPKCSQRADGPDVLGHRRRERDDVVLGGLLDLLDARDVEGAALADVARGLGAARCRRRPSPRRRRSRPAARSRSGAGRSRCAPSPGGCSVESSQSRRSF